MTNNTQMITLLTTTIGLLRFSTLIQGKVPPKVVLLSLFSEVGSKIVKTLLANLERHSQEESLLIQTRSSVYLLQLIDLGTSLFLLPMKVRSTLQNQFSTCILKHQKYLISLLPVVLLLDILR
jgi:hypothetical protein